MAHLTVMQTSLFGGEVPAESCVPPPRSPYLDWKRHNNYRLSPNRNRSCRVCAYYLNEEHHDRKFSKCVKLGISRSQATDIRQNHVCNKFKAIKDNS